MLLLSLELCRHYPEQHFVDIVPCRIALARLRSPRGPTVDVVNLHSFPAQGWSQLQQVDQLRGPLSAMSVACTVLAGDLNCCAPGEGRYDLDAGRIHLDLSVESEAFGGGGDSRTSTRVWPPVTDEFSRAMEFPSYPFCD